MATFRYSVVVCCVGVALACASPSGGSEAAAAPASQASAGPGLIDPLTPARDSVGPSPQRYTWTAIEGVDRYEVEVLNDIDAVMFSHEDVREPALAMPADFTLAAGTYFWRITAVRGGRLVGDSGRSAFVVRD